MFGCVLLLAIRYVEPLGSPALGDPVDILAMTLLGGTLLVITLLCESLHRSRNRQAAAAEALSRSEERFRVALASSPVTVAMMDRGLRYTWVHNPVPGVAAERMLGKRDDELAPPEHVAALVAFKEQVLRTGQGGRKEVHVGSGEGELIYEAAAEPLRDRDGRIVGLTVAAFDITDRKRAETILARQAADLEAQSRELARSNAELEQFASVVAHDVRTPLLSLDLWIKLLRKALAENRSAELGRSIDNIEESARQMSLFIEHLLEYSRVGRGELRPESCDCQQVLEGVLKKLERLLSTAGARITHDALPTVHADCTLMGQLLQNLIENAVKYRAQATPDVHVSALRQAGGWLFSVRDNGIGIPPEQIEHIFLAFHRVQDDESRAVGLGIGLATCKRIVEKHGGRIWVESRRGAGSTFFFALPDR